MKKFSDKKAFNLAMERWGLESQLDMIVEECAELIKVINKHGRGLASGTELVAELVDVSIMIDQMKQYITQIDNRFGVSPGYFKFIRGVKMERLKKKLGGD